MNCKVCGATLIASDEHVNGTCLDCWYDEASAEPPTWNPFDAAIPGIDNEEAQ